MTGALSKTHRCFRHSRPSSAQRFSRCTMRLHSKIVTVLAENGSLDVLKFGSTDFIQDPAKVFSALVDVIYNLRNYALPRFNHPE